MANFTDQDVQKLLSSPGFLYYRDYGSSGAYTKFALLNGLQYQTTVENADVVFDDVGVVSSAVVKESAELSFSSGRVLDFDGLAALSGGLYTIENVTGALVEDATQTVTSGNWAYDVPFLIEHQNGDLSEIVVASVAGSVDGPLVEGTDYFKVKLGEAGWGIYLVDSATITTLIQNVVVTYDYTPNSQKIAKRGGIRTINPIEIAYQTVDSAGNFVKFIFYKAFSSGSDGHGFSPQESGGEPIVVDLNFTAKTDTNRAAGDQLYRKVIGGASLG